MRLAGSGSGWIGPMMHRFANGMEGIHPLVSTMERMDKAAAGFGAALGLGPQSRKRLHGAGHGGRPVGANRESSSGSAALEIDVADDGNGAAHGPMSLSTDGRRSSECP
jgi:hypothetical protein